MTVTPSRGAPGILQRPTTRALPAVAPARINARMPAAAPQRHAPDTAGPTLRNALETAAADQNEDDDVVADFKV